MDKVFVNLVDLQVYVDNMVVKSTQAKDDPVDLDIYSIQFHYITSVTT